MSIRAEIPSRSVRFSETVRTNDFTRCQKPEQKYRHLYRCENLRYQNTSSFVITQRTCSQHDCFTLLLKGLKLSFLIELFVAFNTNKLNCEIKNYVCLGQLRSSGWYIGV